MKRKFTAFCRTKAGRILLTIITIPVGIFVMSCCMNLASRLIGIENILPTAEGNDFLKHVQAVVGVIAALLVVRQLGEETAASKDETLMQQSAFIRDYNLTFITQEKLTEVEQELEKYYSGWVRGEGPALPDIIPLFRRES